MWGRTDCYCSPGRVWSWVFLWLGVLLCGTRDSEPRLWAEEALEAPSAAVLLAAGDRLAEEKRYDDALLKYKEAYEVLVPQLRTLPFREPVTPRLMVRSDLKEYMATELAREVPEPQMKLLDRSLKVLGLVPESLDVRETLLNLYTEEVGGFYNPRTKEMFLIREDPVKRSFLTRWLKGPEFNAEEQRITLAHEMTHALADQHFDLQGLDKVTRGNDDLMLAVSSLIEGEATLVMLGEILGGELSPAMLVELDPHRIDAGFRVLNWVSPFVGGRTLRNAPAVFRQSLIFPYHKGTVFVLHLTNGGGWEAVNAAFREPPLSTEQILHPEKYLGDQPDWPTEIELPRLDERLEDVWSDLGGNTLGELQMQIMLERIPGSQQAAAGWDGDRYRVFQHEDGRLAVGWFTTWDSTEDAREFAIATAHYFGARNERPGSTADARDEDDREANPLTPADGQEARPPESARDDDSLAESGGAPATSVTVPIRERALTAFPSSAEARGLFRSTSTVPERGEREVLVEWRGQDVVIFWGFSPAETDDLRDLIWLSQKAPLRLKR